jgi:hypothetical protein
MTALVIALASSITSLTRYFITRNVSSRFAQLLYVVRVIAFSIVVFLVTARNITHNILFNGNVAVIVGNIIGASIFAAIALRRWRKPDWK